MIRNGTLLFDRQGTDSDARFTGFPSERRYCPRSFMTVPFDLVTATDFPSSDSAAQFNKCATIGLFVCG